MVDYIHLELNDSWSIGRLEKEFYFPYKPIPLSHLPTKTNHKVHKEDTENSEKILQPTTATTATIATIATITTIATTATFTLGHLS
jgi:hypothetical protein